MALNDAVKTSECVVLKCKINRILNVQMHQMLNTNLEYNMKMKM